MATDADTTLLCSMGQDILVQPFWCPLHCFYNKTNRRQDILARLLLHAASEENGHDQNQSLCTAGSFITWWK